MIFGYFTVTLTDAGFLLLLLLLLVFSLFCLCKFV